MYRDHFLGALSLCLSELFILVASKDLQLSYAQWQLHKSETEPSSFISSQNRTEPNRTKSVDEEQNPQPKAQNDYWMPYGGTSIKRISARTQIHR